MEKRRKMFLLLSLAVVFFIGSVGQGNADDGLLGGKLSLHGVF